jgi:hypothetical protein
LTYSIAPPVIDYPPGHTAFTHTFGGNRTGAPGLDFETWDPPGGVRFGPHNVTPGQPNHESLAPLPIPFEAPLKRTLRTVTHTQATFGSAPTKKTLLDPFSKLGKVLISTQKKISAGDGFSRDRALTGSCR